MHIQKSFAETRIEVLQGLIRSRPLATFIVASDDNIIVNHMPLMLDAGAGKYGVLKGHVPRGNLLWQCLDGRHKALAVFHGPETYITPLWYPSKQEHGKAVPTWNYVVVHAHGYPGAVHDAGWLLEHLNAMTDQQEAANAEPWSVADAPSDYVAMMVRNVVGIEMPVSAIEGKWKVSQNRPEADRLAVAAALHARGDANSLAMAALVRGTEA